MYYPYLRPYRHRRAGGHDAEELVNVCVVQGDASVRPVLHAGRRGTDRRRGRSPVDAHGPAEPRVPGRLPPFLQRLLDREVLSLRDRSGPQSALGVFQRGVAQAQELVKPFAGVHGTNIEVAFGRSLVAQALFIAVAVSPAEQRPAGLDLPAV